MSAIDNKRYYWLKLDKDFFKRHDIRIVESMPNGKDYILFYLKLLCESTSHEGYLRFSPTIPYSEDMLATITNTNIDVVRSATKIFSGLGMMSFLDDGTLYLEQVERMIGSETGSAIRKREYRLSQKDIEGTIGGHCPQEIDIELEKDKELEIEKDLEKDINKTNRTNRTNRSDCQSPRTHLNEAIAHILAEKGYVSEGQLEYEGYADLISEWLEDRDPIDLKVKIDYFIWAIRDKTFKPTDNKYFYFKTAMEESFRKDEFSQEDYWGRLEEASKEWGGDDA